MWQTEKQFSNFVLKKLRNKGFNCTRIESASTSSGFPDVYMMGYGEDFFLEFKNTPAIKPVGGLYKIPWRPGQVKFGLEYMYNHIQIVHELFSAVKYSWTIVGGNNRIYMIRMVENYAANYDNAVPVDSNNLFIANDTNDMTDILMAHSRMLRPRPMFSENSIEWNEYVFVMIKCYERFFGESEFVPSDIIKMFNSDFNYDIKWGDKIPSRLDTKLFCSLDYFISDLIYNTSRNQV